MMTDLGTLATATKVMANLMVAFGVPVGIYKYSMELKRQEREREDMIFREADDAFTKLHQLLAEQPDIPVSIYHTGVSADSLTGDGLVRAYLTCDRIASVLEKIYVLFNRHTPSQIKRTQWKGWQAYMRLQVRNPVFRKWWEAGRARGADGYGYDRDFTAFIDDLIAEGPGAPQPYRPSSAAP
ncbi:MAG: hypothetical protein ACM33T_11555 [Solirubrobacterales bacterium]